ncbi:conserved hypothetical protein [Tenacibaculum maritimum]|uniref:VOC family protein n=2 Tax=Tenacibaculum maritimum TaxID=107401 RepID=UPI0012E66E92|nr:VOC family protein [Tenacibaculum maritimum]CAA0170133.1 conserved hypothetical protein [Tenacibaculum maritimum]CAA0174450.1 conserved hypothetical protein [Tenacibaculum maritimum]CAA0176522.1 conserved hypothetical protein [Tenacibaculum maritimum]CAA0250614.1 conserved hypothetical protein [Tenacibaculum maritimum]CAA0251086.1 conserved hypothetical protein [Tenacibaculum maritimum]
MQILGIKTIVPLFTDNVEESIEFYKKIGFNVIGDNKLSFENTKTEINIYKVFNDKTQSILGQQSADIFFISIEIEGLENYKEYLKLNNVIIEDIQNPPIGEYLYIRDPNGNRICIYEKYI